MTATVVPGLTMYSVNSFAVKQIIYLVWSGLFDIYGHQGANRRYTGKQPSYLTIKNIQLSFPNYNSLLHDIPVEAYIPKNAKYE